MLALARKVNESIILNDNIEVTVLEVKGDQVKIGINAPKDVPIYRKELFCTDTGGKCSGSQYGKSGSTW